jgi:hypothetical protein
MNEKCGQESATRAEDQIDEEKLIRQLIVKKNKDISERKSVAPQSTIQATSESAFDKDVSIIPSSTNQYMISASNTMRGENSESIMDITKRTTTENQNEHTNITIKMS